MDELLTIQRQDNNIPFAVQVQLAELPMEAQQDFMAEYTRRKKDVSTSYLAHMITLSEGYLDNWTLQIFFWISFSVGIGPLWWLVNLFRLPGKVRKYNRNLAAKVLRYINYKHKGTGKSTLASLKGQRFEQPLKYIKKRQETLKPREWHIEDETNPSIDSLEMGSMFDFGTETWEVVSEAQYDWEDGLSEKLFKAKEVGSIDSILLFISRDGGHLITYKAMPVNIYAINEGLEMEIMERKRPFNVLNYQDVSYFREYTKTGNAFNLSNKSQHSTEIISWTYFDEDRTRVLRIERHGEQAFKAFAGVVTSPMDFSEIINKSY